MSQGSVEIDLGVIGQHPATNESPVTSTPNRPATVSRRGALLSAFAVGAAGAGIGADVGARIRKENDERRSDDAVAGLVAEARRESRTAAVNAERSAAMAAANHAMRLANGLNASGGQSQLSAQVLNGAVTCQSKEGIMTVRNPVVFGDFVNDFRNDAATQWIGVPSNADGFVGFNLLAIGENSGATIEWDDGAIPKQPVLEVGLYTVETKGGPDQRQLDVWLTLDGQTAWKSLPDPTYIQ